MAIYESDLPGVGKKFEIELQGSERLVIVTHNTGKREVYKKANEDADSEKLFDLSDQLARTVGTILEGAYFQPVQTSGAETKLSEETFLEWYDVDKTAEIAGISISDARIDEQIGVSILAIQRDEELITPVTPDTVIEAGDKVIVAGEQEECLKFEKLIGDVTGA
ncbi:TrkA C-terminal domain-containing protein [Natronococcus sp. A-GB1]|uniref:cation:proton antiporter regulatory subunit n=1 Tax=Natronococcus sp. A-GB1 TaxID=3037648 RepID=UPI00241FA55B|nr:TrkA C-terminal domain-containing protein [Natronococcus sp. A-GB1]MDG5762102.1 TrkA C-terminal domain-containing protein [Natronococcus sp. A-GB1]